MLATALALPATANAAGHRLVEPRSSSATRQPRAAPRASAQRAAQDSSTDPIALSLELAERYWHGVPACGTPVIVTSPHQLPNSVYEKSTGPEPMHSVVEMWTEVQKCTITINTSIWGSWHQDDESFQWFCDAMTHEVGHLFGHLDSGHHACEARLSTPKPRTERVISVGERLRNCELPASRTVA